MSFFIDDTHDAALQSWLASANDPATEFPIQNLPLGRFRTSVSAPWRLGTAIGDQIVDLQLAGLVKSQDANRLIGSDLATRQSLRRGLSEGLRAGSAEQAGFEAALVPQSTVELGLPCYIGDYTDFYTSLHHATTIGKQFRPDNPLLPNYKWVPIGYHGRASSICASGHGFHRPNGQTKAPDADAPKLGPCARLDYELELGIVVGRANAMGDAVAMQQAQDHVFGLALFNDWSARDIQGWEYQPLGPFLSKNFASTLSPWIVTMEALAPYHLSFTRPADDPQPLPYLDSPENRAGGAMDIELEVWLQTGKMRADGHAGERLSCSNFKDAYWSVAQLIAHHTVNGCNLASGDLLGSGTLSGPLAEQGGSMMELSGGGKKPIGLANGESRTWLQDGDSIILRGYCQRQGFRRIGFGECRGTVLPARSPA